MTTRNNQDRCCNRDGPLPNVATVQQWDNSVERIPCDISREEFVSRYEDPQRPVILLGCANGWPAQSNWNLETLKGRFSDEMKIKATFDRTQQHWQVAPWGKVVEAIDDNQFFYIFDQLQQDREAQSLEQDYLQPGPFRDVDLYRTLDDFPHNYGRRRWFVMGSNNSGTDPHVDPSATDAWNTAIHGYKWWILFPPSVDLPDVLCNDACSVPVQNRTTAHWFATIGSDSRTWHQNTNEEMVAEQPVIHLLQRPGETLYVPSLLVHAVYNLEVPCVGVTEKYAAPTDVSALWQALVYEGDVNHRREFYFSVLSASQRRTVRTSGYFDPSHLGLNTMVLKLLDEFGVLPMVGLFLLVTAALLWWMMSWLNDRSPHNSTQKRRIVEKKTVIIRKSKVS